MVILTILSMADVLSVQVASYNCRGYNAVKRQYIRNLLSKVSILFLQEIWLSDGQIQELGDIDSNFLYTGISGFDNTDVLSGRPFGGVAILWRSDLSVTVSVLATNSKRVCAVRMDSDVYKMLFINVYMPYEGDDCTTNDFADQLINIENICNNNSECHVIVGGDFNVDFARDRLHTVLLNNFCDTIGLNPVIRHNNYNVDYSYNFGLCRFSILDHFLLSGSIYDNSVISISVMHDADNASDHDPIVLHLSLELKYIGFSARAHVQRVSWVKATDSDLYNYRCALSNLLSCLKLPVDALLCSDLDCRDVSHFQALDVYAKDITEACLIAAENSIPHTCNRQSSGRLPGWSEHVQPLRDKSLFWHNLWLDCGRPKTGAVADSMRRTRAAYHYAIRRLKKDEESILRERVADGILSDGGRNFWSEIKRIRSNKASTSRIVDGQTDVSNIARLFADKYRELYTSVPFNKDEMQCIVDDVNNAVINDSLSADCIFNIHDVKSAVDRLKPHKSDGGSGLSTDHFVKAGDDCLVHIAFLFSAINVHGTAPHSFCVSTIVPIPKGRNANVSDSANFRGIALSPVYGKIFDNIVLNRYSDKLISSELQFGFKAQLICVQWF